MLLPWFYRSEDWSSLWCEVEHMVGVKQLCVLGCVLMLPCFKIWQVISPPALRFSVTLWNLPLPWTTPAPKHPSPIIFAEHQLFYVLIIYSSIPPRKFVQLPLGPWITDFTILLPFSPFLCPPPILHSLPLIGFQHFFSSLPFCAHPAKPQPSKSPPGQLNGFREALIHLTLNL